MVPRDIDERDRRGRTLESVSSELDAAIGRLVERERQRRRWTHTVLVIFAIALTIAVYCYFT